MDLIRESSFAQLPTQQAREQGRRERAIEALLNVLKIRFALGAAEPLVARMRGIEGLQHLKLHRADRLEAFQPLRKAAE